MRKILFILLGLALASCEHSNLNSKIDTKTGYGVIDYGNEGSVILGPGFVIVKRDSTYYVPQNGNTYHTMAVKVYSVPNCKMDSVLKSMPFADKDTTWNQ